MFQDQPPGPEQTRGGWAGLEAGVQGLVPEPRKPLKAFFPAQTLIIDELQQQQETLEASSSSLVLGFTVT